MNRRAVQLKLVAAVVLAKLPIEEASELAERPDTAWYATSRSVDQAKKTLDKAFKAYDAGLTKMGGPWAMGSDFTMADCSFAPALFYMKMVYPFDAYKNITAYAGRLFERPSITRVISEVVPMLEKFGVNAK